MENQNYDQNGQNNYQDYTAQYQGGGSSYPYETEQKTNTTNGMQIASLVLGILGMLTCCCYGVVGLVLGIIGLIMAIMGNHRSRSGVGVAGLVCSIIAIILGIAGTIYFILIYFAIYQQAGPFVDMLKGYTDSMPQFNMFIH